MSGLLLPVERFDRWVHNFGDRHGPADIVVSGGGLAGTAADGSTFVAALPFGREYDGAPDVAAFVAQAAPPPDWGVLLVRKGGFAVARLDGDEMVAHKVGQRHVQGRTKAGGQSQQRFARRRDNQARAAYGAAAGHAHRILRGVAWLVTGGDRAALAETLQAAGLVATIDPRVLDAAEPRRRSVLDAAAIDARALAVEVVNAD